MTAEEYKNFSTAVSNTPKVVPAVTRPVIQAMNAERPAAPAVKQTVLPPVQTYMPPPPPVPAPKPAPAPVQEQITLPIQEELPMPKEIPWRMVGELYRSYILVEQGDEAFLIDKHAAHERILFERLRANPTEISSQTLLTPVPVRLRADAAAQLLAKTGLLEELGFEIDEFGENTLLVRRVPMDLDESQIADTLMEMADDLLSGRSADTDTVRDDLLHTMACKAAIKAGWKTDEKELLALVKEVMAREELKYCPHGRPICITLSKKMLEKQFKRT
jgi:DNA mismatch repair protein MutL